MDLEFIVVVARNLTGDNLRALVAQGWEPNHPSLLVFSRPKQPAPPIVPQIVQHPPETAEETPDNVDSYSV